ncbi:MAG TPA: hypothetical protein VL687_04435 [Methylomirabilota bacterium]|jgi:hypothetical protein|nr:hypothetical protein [Methylomirabilota bacterium]
MGPDSSDIDAYIRANRGTYTDEAMRDALIAVGHDASAIEAAFGRLGFQPGWNPIPDPGPATGLVAEAWILFIVGGLTALTGFLAASGFNSSGSLPLFLVAYLGIGLAIVLLVRWAVPKLGIRGAWAAVIGVALVPIFGTLMVGTCAAAFMNPGG